MNQPTSEFVKTKSGTIYQIILHQSKPDKILLRIRNDYKESSLKSIKQGLVDGKFFEVNEHEKKAWIEKDTKYMDSLTKKIVKRIIISQLLIELDEELIEDFESDKRMRSVLTRSTKECERVTVKKYDKLYKTNKTFLTNFINEVDKFTTTCSNFDIHEFIFLNKMVKDYMDNPDKFQPETVQLTKIQ